VRRGQGWAYTGAILGGVVSIAANVAHSYVPPEGGTQGWSPQPGAVIGAVFWPLALFVAIEILAKVAWPLGRRWVLLRFLGLLPVALVAAVVSYRHLSGLLAYYGEDGLTVALGPLAVDGLMVMATGALIAVGRTAVDGPSPQVSPATADASGKLPEASGPAVPDGDGPSAPAGTEVDGLLLVGQAVAGELAASARALTRDALAEGVRARGHAISTARASELLRQVRAA